MLQKTAAQIVKENYYEYGKFINLGGRVICDEKDGLKGVHRKILYAAYKIASNRPVKTATLVGETMGKYHPHGDAGIAGAVAGFVRDGLLDGVGNFGSNVGLDIIEPAAMRYTECKLSEKIIKLCFKYVEDVPYFNNDLSFMEPEYLPTPLPINLCHFADTEDYVSAIGFGVAYTLPKFDVMDMFHLLQDIVEGKPIKNKVHLRYKSLKMPCSDKLFYEGFDSVNMTARYIVNKDRKSFNVIELPIMTKTYTPKKMLEPFDTIPQDFSKATTNIFVELTKGRTVDDYDMDKLLTTKVNLNMYFHNGSIIKRYSLPEIIKTTYSYYKQAVNNNLSKKIKKMQDHISTVELLIKIKPYLNPLDEHTAERVMKKCKLDDKTVDSLLKYTIKQICSAEAHLDESKNTLKDLNSKKTHIDDFCLCEIEESLKGV